MKTNRGQIKANAGPRPAAAKPAVSVADIPAWLAYAGAVIAGWLPFVALIPHLASRYIGSPYTDMRITYRHWLRFAVSSVFDGEVPMWNPYIFCGQPFMPSTHGTLFYPPNWPWLLLLPQPLSINLCILTQVAILALGLVYFARLLGVRNAAALLAGVVASLGSLMTCRVFVGHFTIMCTAPWIPIMFALQYKLFTGVRSAWLPFALAGACMFMGGHLQYAYYFGLFLALSVVLYGMLQVESGARSSWFKGQLGLHLLAGGAAFALVAIEALPAIDIARHSIRNASGTLEWLRHFSLPPGNLVTMLAPRFWGSGVDYWGRWEWWEACFYIGVLPLGLVLSMSAQQLRSRRCNYLVVMFLVMVALAVIGYIPALNQVMRLVPGWTMFRGHNRPLSFAVVFGAVLAAQGFEAFLRAPDGPFALILRRVLLVFVALGAVLLLVAGPAFWQGVLSSPGHIDELSNPNPLRDPVAFAHTVSAARWSAALAVILAGTGWLLVRVGVRLGERVAMAAVLAFVLVDLLIFACPKPSFQEPDVDTVPGKEATFFRSMGDQARSGVSRMLNEGTSHRIPSIEGDDIVITKYNNTLLCRYLGLEAIRPNFTFFLQGESPALDAMNFAYVSIPTDSPAARSGMYQKVQEFGPSSVFKRPTALPRAYVVGSAKWVGDDEEQILRALAGVDFHREVLLTGKTTDGPQERFEALPAAVEYRGLHRVNVDAPRDGWLVLVDGYYPWWRASVNGGPVPVYRANSSFRAVRVKQGERVEFRYDNPFFKAGAFVSMCAAIGLIGCAGLAIRQRLRA